MRKTCRALGVTQWVSDEATGRLREVSLRMIMPLGLLGNCFETDAQQSDFVSSKYLSSLAIILGRGIERRRSSARYVCLDDV